MPSTFGASIGQHLVKAERHTGHLSTAGLQSLHKQMCLYRVINQKPLGAFHDSQLRGRSKRSGKNEPTGQQDDIARIVAAYCALLYKIVSGAIQSYKENRLFVVGSVYFLHLHEGKGKRKEEHF